MKFNFCQWVVDISLRCQIYISFSLNLTLVPVEENFEVHTCPMVVTENLLSLHLSCPSVSVIENFKVPICPSVPVTGMSKSVFVPATKGSRMASLHMSQYFPVSQYFPEYYRHCLIRRLQISLWEMIRQLLSQCLFWERTHFREVLKSGTTRNDPERVSLYTMK